MEVREILAPVTIKNSSYRHLFFNFLVLKWYHMEVINALINSGIYF